MGLRTVIYILFTYNDPVCALCLIDGRQNIGLSSERGCAKRQW